MKNRVAYDSKTLPVLGCDIHKATIEAQPRTNTPPNPIAIDTPANSAITPIIRLPNAIEPHVN